MNKDSSRSLKIKIPDKDNAEAIMKYGNALYTLSQNPFLFLFYILFVSFYIGYEYIHYTVLIAYT